MTTEFDKSTFSKKFVKYDSPIAVIAHESKSSKEGAQKKTKSYPSKIQSTLPPISSKQEAVDILHQILPPLEWEKDGQKWIQKVSTTPATRTDVINLQEELDIELEVNNARETGLCRIRRNLYDQCFEEVIRQVAINCNKRGILLVRIRDELLMTLKAYETLYQSSIAFGIRKTLLATQMTEKQAETIKELTEENEQLKQLTINLEKKADYTEKQAAESREAIIRQHEEEVSFLKKINTQLKAQLEGIIAPGKK